MTIKYALILITNALFLVIGQTLLKKGMDIEQVLSIRAFLNPRVLGGLGIYCLCTLVWLYILPRVTFSIAYPLNSVAYIFSMLTAYFILGESITVSRVIGTATIIIGVIIVTR